MNLRPTHESVTGGKTLVRSPIVNHIPFLHRWATVTLLVGGAMMQASAGNLRQDGGRAEVKLLSQEVVPSFRASQAATVGVDAGWSLVGATA